MTNNNILWLPLDLPPIDKELTFDKIKKHYSYVRNLDLNEIKEYQEKKQHHLYAWDVFKIRIPNAPAKEVYKSQSYDISWNWTHQAKILCPNLIKYIETHLPFKKIKYVTAINSKGKIPLHFDHTEECLDGEKQYYRNHDPCFYRLILDGKINVKSFYVYTKSLGKIYCVMPDLSPGWVMGSYSCAHGNDEEVSNQKLILYVMGDLDEELHRQLIDRSYLKYKKYSITKDNEV